MPRKRIKGDKAVVYVCTVSPIFKPQRCWDVPDGILSAKLHAKNLKMESALDFARIFNLKQVQDLEHGRVIESWAIVVRHLKPGWHPARTLERVASQEGGDL
jgi:hypothetical protein